MDSLTNRKRICAPSETVNPMRPQDFKVLRPCTLRRLFTVYWDYSINVFCLTGYCAERATSFSGRPNFKFERREQLSPIASSVVCFEAEAPSSKSPMAMATTTKTKLAIETLVSSPFSFLLLRRRGLAVWSMKKDPALEAALSRNRRWIVNNQIKQLLLRSPSRVAPVRSLQRMYKTLDLRGRALNWLRKYPSCFDTFPDPNGGGGGELFFGFTKRMAALVAEEEAAIDASEPAMARRLAKLLMLARDRRIRVAKLGELKRALGLPDDYLLRLLPSHPDLFRLVSPYGPRSAMEIELARWAPDLAVSAVEAAARGGEAPPPPPPRFVCSLPHSWVRSRARFDEFNEGTPYVSPYAEDWGATADAEKRAVGAVHELLSLTLYKKLSIVKLEHFKREFGLPEQLNRMLLRHPCIFYVSNRYKIYTVVLREGYDGSELVDKDPLVVAKERLGELMQEGLHEYNRRRQLANLEKRRKRGEIGAKQVKEEEDEDQVSGLDSVEKREERKRFYKVLFDEN